MSGRDPDALIHVADVVKDYQALRPLRLKSLTLQAGQSVALRGLDKTAAEVLVNMLTGASLPDSGAIHAFGRPTSEIADSESWLTLLRRFALLSDRTVLVEQLTVEQNLAIPHTLDLDPMAEDVRARVRAVGAEVGLADRLLGTSVGGLGPLDLALVRLGRVLALDADVLLAEHPTATLSPTERDTFGRTLAAIVARRRMAAVYITADETFAKIAGGELLTLKPATGELVSHGGWRRWFALGQDAEGG